MQVVFTGKEIIGGGMAAKNTKKSNNNKKNNSKKKKVGEVAAKGRSRDKEKSRKKARLEIEDEENEYEESEDEESEDGESEEDLEAEGDDDEKDTKDKENKIENVMFKKFVIMSYDLVNKYEDQLKGKNFQLIIADESHFLKSRDVSGLELCYFVFPFYDSKTVPLTKSLLNVYYSFLLPLFVIDQTHQIRPASPPFGTLRSPPLRHSRVFASSRALDTVSRPRSRNVFGISRFCTKVL